MSPFVWLRWADIRLDIVLGLIRYTIMLILFEARVSLDSTLQIVDCNVIVLTLLYSDVSFMKEETNKMLEILQKIEGERKIEKQNQLFWFWLHVCIKD